MDLAKPPLPSALESADEGLRQFVANVSAVCGLSIEINYLLSSVEGEKAETAKTSENRRCHITAIRLGFLSSSVAAPEAPKNGCRALFFQHNLAFHNAPAICWGAHRRVCVASIEKLKRQRRLRRRASAIAERGQRLVA